ncbi:MAG: hypothetical protein JXX29_23865 [Deltaproteobacteria bacterium]|nr:hypothetical protein [Deltaproteobacteria bacterium]MBN2674739.1 hypothetical protein [Deltaproteobacteria bacterium]
MGSGIYTALSGAIASESKVEILSHNLANANSAGFQGFRAVMETEQGRVANEELTFASKPQSVKDTSPGPIVNTHDPMDLALFNGVYMEVMNGEDRGYVHGATLIPMDDGRVLTTDGHVVLDESGSPMTIPSGVVDLRVQSDGAVFADGVPVSRLSLVEFEDEQALLQGQGRFIQDNGNANPSVAADVRPVMSGYMEMSNVSAVKSVTDLISAQHSYSASLKMIESINSMDKKAAEGLLV